MPIHEGIGQLVHISFPQEWITEGMLPEVPSSKSQINPLTFELGKTKEFAERDHTHLYNWLN